MNDKILQDKLYSLQEVAKHLRVSERSVFRYIHSGKLKATKIGYWRISSDDLKAFLVRGSNAFKYIGTQFPKPKPRAKKTKNKK